MDFINNLPEIVAYIGTYDVIFVVIDKFIKSCHFINCYLGITARKLPEMIISKIVLLHKIV